MKYYFLEGNLKSGIPTDEAFHQVLEAHHAYLQSFFNEGKILASGPKAGGRGGVILLCLNDEESVEKFCTEDPFAKSNIQTYRIVEFELFQIQDYAAQWKNGPFVQ